jgi:hypothetical protein
MERKNETLKWCNQKKCYFIFLTPLTLATDLLEQYPNLPTSSVLLADILPGLLAQGVAPFFMHLIPYGYSL